MRTPCQDNPELWVGESAEARVQAVVKCRTCPALEWCARDTADAEPTHGVWAGVDYSRNSVTAHRICACEQCGAMVVQRKTGRPRRFCDDKCYNAFRYAHMTIQSKVCATCGAEFARGKLSAAQWQGRRFCSQKCFGRSKAVAA